MIAALPANLRARPAGGVALDPTRLAPELAVIDGFTMDPCVGYAVGPWRKSVVMARDERGALAPNALGAQLPYVAEQVQAAFYCERVALVQIFAAGPGAYVRPHVDWTAAEPIFTRLHVPLRTDERCFSSEDDTVYQMRAGEIWFVDGSRPHSAGCFSAITRLHLVVEGDPDVPPEALVRAHAPGSARIVERPPLRAEQLDAILALGALVTQANLMRIADLLGTVHFCRRVSCADLYDWLIEIARRAADAVLVRRCEELKRTYLAPFTR